MTDLQITLDSQTLQALLSGDPDGMRILTQHALQQLLEAQMSEHLGAQPHERTHERRGSRNGHYERKLTTRVGQLTLRVPRDRDGSFSTELFERYSRCEKALVATLVEMVVQGVSTRKVRKITQELCGQEFSKSTISEYVKQLDQALKVWRERELEEHYPFVLVDAIYVKVREEGQVRSRALMVATGVGASGVRRILGCELGHTENQVDWSNFFAGLKQRGLSGVELVISDAHEGLVQAVHRQFVGVAWQRCQTHFRRNVTQSAPKRHQRALNRALDRILNADELTKAREAAEQMLAEFEGTCAKPLKCMENGWKDACTVLSLPEKYRRKLRTTNMLERLNRELRRRDKVIGIYPNENSALRLMGTQLLEHDEAWMGRTYIDMQEYYEHKQSLKQPSDEPHMSEAAAE